MRFFVCLRRTESPNDLSGKWSSHCKKVNKRDLTAEENGSSLTNPADEETRQRASEAGTNITNRRVIETKPKRRKNR
jgi:hypothetical protein